MRILIVDDHHLFREGVRLILAQVLPEADIALVESCEAAVETPPDDTDLVLLDYHLPGASEFDAFNRIREHFYRAVVVIVSGDEHPGTIRHLIASGAAGYIPKSSSPEVLLAALELITAGGSYLPPAALEEDPVGTDGPDAVTSAISSLSPRQRAVLAKAIQGKINKVIADELDIAEGTVKAHLSAAYRTLGVGNRAEAVYLVTRHEVSLRESL